MNVRGYGLALGCFFALGSLAGCSAPSGSAPAAEKAHEARPLLRVAGPVVERPVGQRRLTAAVPAVGERALLAEEDDEEVHAIFRDLSVLRFVPVRLDETAFDRLPASDWEEDWGHADLMAGGRALDLERDFQWTRRVGPQEEVVLTGRPLDGPGLASLVRVGDQIVGDIAYGMRNFQVRRLAGADDDYVLIEYRGELLAERRDRMDDVGALGEAAAAPPGPTGDESWIDVLIVTTAAAGQAWKHDMELRGLEPNTLESELFAELIKVNQALEDSGVITSSVLRQAGGYVFVSSFVESGSSKTDTERLVSGSAGREIRRQRDERSADLVVLVADETDCGYAAAVGPAKDLAFATVSWFCLDRPGYRTLHHEIGHLLGARHEIENDPESAPYPYQHGYHGGTGLFTLRTLMTYECHGSATNCPLIPRWSNPSRPWDVYPTGRLGESDNAAVLRANLSAVAGFR